MAHMRQITTFNDVNEVLKRYVPHVPLGHRYSLDRMQALMKYLGNPQDKLRVVHIAGTSGKTSTAYYIAAMLHAGGYKVGLTVSPHVDGINERVQINGRPLEEAAFTKEFTRFLKLIEQFDDEPTYFEVLIAFVYWLFYKRSVDYEVIEVGLGGLLDGTNVAKRPDKICVITDIGLDHMDVLGQTVDKIAAQKAGIIHPHNKVFSYVQSDKVMAVIRNVAAKNQAELHEITPSARSTPSDLPLFQRRNWYLANKVSEYILGTNGQSLSPAALATTVQTLVPARMEAIEVGDKTVIIDGSHKIGRAHV